MSANRYPSIDQFRNVIRNVQSRTSFVGKDADGLAIFDSTIPMPRLDFRGTVKVHGTNASVGYNVAKDTFFYQSRSRVLNLQSDNAGFMLYMMQYEAELREMFSTILNTLETAPKQIIIYGEWAGQGIQKGVAVSEVPKFFAYFGIKTVGTEGETWLDVGDFRDLVFEKARIYNITWFGTWNMSIDMAHPALAQQALVELTEKVEAECPVGGMLISQFVQNSCTVLFNDELQWRDDSITSLAAYKEIKTNILNYVKTNSIADGSVIELSL